MNALSVSRVADFVNSLGVDTHLSYTDGAYANVNNVVADLKYIGLTHVRDGLANAAHLAAYQAVAAQGVRFTLDLVGQTQSTATLNSALSLALALSTATPGAVQAMEGANEINNWPITYNGVGGIQGALDLQGDLYKTVHGSPAFQGVAVDYFTGYAAGAVSTGPNPLRTPGLADFDTQHPYPTKGLAPGAQIDPMKSLTNEQGGPVGPSVFTETGYSSNGGMRGAVNQDVQAKYTLDLLLDAFKDGVAQTFLYNLLDAYAPGSKQGDDGFGLFNPDNSPKLVATALHNLTSILADNGAAASHFALATLNPTLSGLPPTGNELVLQKSNGAFDIVVWAEPQIWNAATGVEVAAPGQSVTVDFGQAFRDVSIFDPLVGGAAIQTVHNAKSVRIAVTDHPVIVEVSGALFSASTIAALSMTDIAGLAYGGVRELQTADRSVTLSLAQALALAASGVVVAGGAGLSVMVTDGAAPLQGLTGAQIQLLASIGVTSLAATSGSVNFAPTASAALAASQISVTAPGAVTESFSDGHSVRTTFASDGSVKSVTHFNSDGSYDALGYGQGSFRGVAYAAADSAYSATRALEQITYYNSAQQVVASKTYELNGGYTISIGGLVDCQSAVNTDGSAFISHENVRGSVYSSWEQTIGASGQEWVRAFDNLDGSGVAKILGANLCVTVSAHSIVATDGRDSFDLALHPSESFTMLAGAGDLLRFSAGFGADSVSGFGPTGATANRLDLTSLFSSYQSFQAHETVSANNILIADAFGDTLTLLGVASSALTATRIGF